MAKVKLECDEDIHIDRWGSLHAAPGYNAAVRQFVTRYEGGEPVYKCLEMALMVFHEARKEAA